MSVWTHIAAVIRIDSVGYIVGVPDNAVEDAIQNIVSLSDIPAGSEGPAKWDLARIHNEIYPLLFGNLIIYGDLRDYDDAAEIQEWLHDIIKKLEKAALGVRGFAGSIEVETKGMYSMYLTRKEDNSTIMRSLWIESGDEDNIASHIRN